MARWLVLSLVMVMAAGCGVSSSQMSPTPTIVPVSEETRAAVQTAAAQRLLGGPSEATTPAPTTAVAEATPTATPSPSAAEPAATATVASGEGAPATPAVTATPVPLVMAGTSTPAAEPVPLPTEHVVRYAENLTKIARRYGVTVRDLVEANGIENPSAIYVGQVLLVPAPQPAAAVPTVTAAPSSAAAGTPSPTPAPGIPRIAFQLSSGAGIYSVNEDGSGLVRLTQGLDPAWSPDGSLLAFVRWDEPRGLFLLDPASGREWLVRGGNLMKSPTWNPTGDRIAYSWETSGAVASRMCFPGFGCVDLPGQAAWSLTVVDRNGDTIADLPADERSFSPSWSPAGDLIAYQGERALKGTDLGAQPWIIVDDPAAAFPAVSPDGRHIAFMYRQHDHWEVYVVGADGAGLTRLTTSSPLADRPANNVAPAWSPDGERLVFLTDRDGDWRPYVMSADGGGQTPFLPEVFDQFTFRYEFSAERVFSWR